MELVEQGQPTTDFEPASLDKPFRRVPPACMLHRTSGLCYRRQSFWEEPLWAIGKLAVLHYPSGYSIGVYLNSEAAAQTFIRLVAPLTDWYALGPEREAPAELVKQVGEIYELVSRAAQVQGGLNREKEGELIMSVEEKVNAAHQMISDLCNGRRDWIMRIPAQPNYDPDLVIGNALRAQSEEINRLLALITGLESQLSASQLRVAELEKQEPVCSNCGDEMTCMSCWSAEIAAGENQE